jgi:L-threonylcarbamoyladenylate synthase
MKIIKLTPNNYKQTIKEAVGVLKKGGLVIYPTETVYGAGVDAAQQRAVDKLLHYKSRREGKPLSIAVCDQKMAENYVVVNKQAQQLYQKFLPGPFTIISQSKGNLARGVASEFNTLGIRIPDYQLILDLVKELNSAITATSANASEKKRPYSIQDILNNLSQKQKNLIELVIDAGQLPKNDPSIVIDTTLSTPLTIRDSSQQNFDFNKKLNKKVINFISQSDKETQEIAGKILLKNWGKIKEKGLVIGLNGELGAGKTVFAKGIAKFLKIEEKITSPTYTYLKEYQFNRHQIKGNFFHLDLWKINDPLDAQTFQVKKLIKSKNVLAIEWWTQTNTLVPKINPDLIINIKVIAENKRQLTLFEK